MIGRRGQRAAIAVLSVALLAAGCSGWSILPGDITLPSSLSFPKAEAPAKAPAKPPANAPAPTPVAWPEDLADTGRARLPSSTDTTYSWAELSARGRAAMAQGDYAAAEGAFLSALVKTNDFPDHDVRLKTSLINLTYLAQAMERAELYEQSSALIEILIDQELADRRVTFDVAGPLMLVQAQRLRAAGNEVEAARIAQAALRLSGASDPINAHLRAQAEEALWPTPASGSAE